MAKPKRVSNRRVEQGIYQRTSGKYAVPIWDPITRKRLWTHPDMPPGGFERLADARQFKRDRETEKAKGGSTLAVTCDAYAKAWPKGPHRRPDETTNINAERMLRQFRRDFADVPMREVPRRLARLYVHGGPVPAEYAKLARRWKGTTVEDGVMIAVAHQSAYKQIRAMWNDAVDDNVIGHNPFAALKVSNGSGRSEVLMLSDAELDLLVRCATDAMLPENEWFGRNVLGPMILTSAGTGMRPGELLAMRWHCVDLEAEEIHIKQQRQGRTNKLKEPKLGSVRTVPLLPRVRDALGGVPRFVDSDFVFHTVRGRPFKQRSLQYYWAMVRKHFHAQLEPHRQEEIDPQFDYYELRHWFGSYLGRLRGPRGEVLVSPQDIAKMFGHKDGGKLAMELYIHTDGEEARERVKAAVRLQAQVSTG